MFRFLSSLKEGRIGYFGETNRRNLGDDAVFTVLKHQHVGQRFKELVADWDRTNLKAFRKRILGSSSVLIGGGTQLTPDNKHYFDIMLDVGRSLKTFGTGVGSSGFGEASVRDLTSIIPFIKRLDPLTVRGPASAEGLRHYGILNAHVIGDPALGYARKSHVSVSHKTKIMCVNLITPSRDSEILQYHRLFSCIAKFLHRLAQEGWRLNFIAVGPGDMKTISDFLCTYKIPVDSLVAIETNPEDYLDAVASANIVFGIRLHSAVLAACVGVPFMLVEYRPKCRDFAASIGRSDFLVDPHSATEATLYLMCERILERGDALRREILEVANSFSLRQRNFLKQQIV